MIIGFVHSEIVDACEIPKIFKCNSIPNSFVLSNAYKVYDTYGKYWIKYKFEHYKSADFAPIPTDEEVFMWLLEAEEI